MYGRGFFCYHKDMIYAMIAVVIITALAIWLVNTRGARLKHLAKTTQMRYEARLESVLTPQAQQASLFFQQGVHRFRRALTGHEPGAFVRVCDDEIFSSDTATAPDMTYTLVTAELTKGTFTPIILSPRRPGQTDAPHPALPPQLAEQYLLSAPDTFQLPELVIGFLQSAKPCYLELTPTALIYHEFDAKPVAQIQEIRFRARQLLRALVMAPAPANPASTQTFTQTFTSAPTQTFTNTSASTQTSSPFENTQTFAANTFTGLASTQTSVMRTNEPDLEALMRLKMQSAPRSYSQAAGQTSDTGRWVFAIIFVIIMIAMCWITAHFLPQWLHK